MMLALEHFYYGRLVHHGTPAGELRILARSAGMTDEQIETTLRSAMLAPDEAVPQGTWAVIRNETSRDVPFLMIQAQKGKYGQETWHFIYFPRDTVTALAGNLRATFPLVENEVRVFEMLGDMLPPIELAKPELPSTAEQVDSLLELMTFTNNNTRNIEPLLSAVVRNVPLVVQNAAPDIMERMNFIQGLLALLPSSTRFNTTFATYLKSDSSVHVKIAFMDGEPPADAVVYDRATGAISGTESKDDYSRYIVSQLRLDAELVTQQTEALTGTAGWRFRTGDSLADSLAYASTRQKIDNSLLTSQPVAVEEVSKILADDPTLDDNMRRVYAEHLIKLSLATRDMKHTDPVAVTMNHFPDLADGIHKLMADAVQGGEGALIFETLQRWMDNPLAPQGPHWITLLHNAALGELDELAAAHDKESVLEWLNDMIRLDRTMGIDRIARRIIEMLIPMAATTPEVAARLLLMAITHLDSKEVQNLLAQPGFVRHLPGALKRFLTLLNHPETDTLQGALIAAADAMGEAGRDKAVVLLAEMAYQAERYSLLDTPTLEELARIAITPTGRDRADLMVVIARRIQEDWLPALTDPGPRCVLQLFLAARRYEMLAKAMIDQSREVYGIDRQIDYLRSIQAAFSLTPLAADAVIPLRATLEHSGIQGVALWAATAGMLESIGNAPNLVSLADKLSEDMRSQPESLEILPVEIPFSLLQYYHAIQDEAGLKSAIRLVPVSAAFEEDKTGLGIISRTYKLLRGDSDKAGQRLGFEAIRNYVRRAGDRTSNRAVTYYGKELGQEAGERLEIAYHLSRFLGRMDFAAYGGALHATMDMLQTATESYGKRAEKPALKRLQTVCDNLRVRMDERNRRAFGEALRDVAQSIVTLGKQQENPNAAAAAKRQESIIKGSEAPKTGLEVMRFAGGHLAKGRAFPLKLADGVATTSPLGDLAPETLRQNALSAAVLLQSALHSAPGWKWQPQAVALELDNLLTTITLPVEEGRNLIKQMALDFQRLSDLIPVIYRESDVTVLEEENKTGKRLDTGQQEPRSVLELLRFMYAFFLGGRT